MNHGVPNSGDSDDDDALLAATMVMEGQLNAPLQVPEVGAGTLQDKQLAAKSEILSAADFQNLAHALKCHEQSQQQQPQPIPKRQKTPAVPDAPGTAQSSRPANVVADWACLSQQAPALQQPSRIAVQNNVTPTAVDPMIERNRDMISTGVLESQIKATDAVRMAHFYELLSMNFWEPADVQWAQIIDFVKQYSKA
jgi:hypothetical protein